MGFLLPLLAGIGKGALTGAKAVGAGVETAGKAVGHGLGEAADWMGKDAPAQNMMHGMGLNPLQGQPQGQPDMMAPRPLPQAPPAAAPPSPMNLPPEAFGKRRMSIFDQL